MLSTAGAAGMPSCSALGVESSSTEVIAPSEVGRLMAEVFPEVPTRRWVCSLPWRLRVLLGEVRPAREDQWRVGDSRFAEDRPKTRLDAKMVLRGAVA